MAYISDLNYEVLSAFSNEELKAVALSENSHHLATSNDLRKKASDLEQALAELANAQMEVANFKEAYESLETSRDSLADHYGERIRENQAQHALNVANLEKAHAERIQRAQEDRAGILANRHALESRMEEELKEAINNGAIEADASFVKWLVSNYAINIDEDFNFMITLSVNISTSAPMGTDISEIISEISLSAIEFDGGDYEVEVDNIWGIDLEIEQVD